MDCAVAKQRWIGSSVESLRVQLLSVRSNFHMYRKRLPLCTERFTAGVTEHVVAFLYCLHTELRKLVKKQCERIQTTAKTDLEDIDAFLRSTDSKLSQPVPFC